MAVSELPADLTQGAEGVFAAIRARYADEKTFHDKLEPFEDGLRSSTRDGLVEYLLTEPDGSDTNWRARFRTPDDLYHHFLMDVSVEGCARTSRVVAAISSVQLYVHRVLMNLEQNTATPPVTARFDSPERQAEWAWRKNFQVWVANRKVFLYPENYIEPDLRDDKTPLFRELEDTLLQQQITEQNVLDAYAQYLHGFEEVSKLRIAGAYHDRRGTAGDLLHLFGVTASEPPVYYYRTVRNLENSAGPAFSAWEKVDVQIPVRKVSPIIYLGRLYVFWVETTTRPLNEFKDGSSQFGGYRHSVRTKYSQLRLDGRWSPPQMLRVTETGITTDYSVVEDIRKNRPQTDPLFPGDYVPWDMHNRNHKEAIETYRPEGWKWEKVYLDVSTPSDRGANPQLRLSFFPRASQGSPWMEVVDLAATTSRRDTAKYTESYIRGFKWIRGVASWQLVPGLTFFDNATITGPSSARATSMWNEQWPPAGSAPIIELPRKAEIEIIAGGQGSVFFHIDGESSLLLVEGNGLTYSYRWLGTSLVNKVTTSLTLGGITALLSVDNQAALVEESPQVAILNSSVTPLFSADPISPLGAFSTYYREVFFHIPFLIANHFNSQQKFADAQRWYHYLYNPTANEPTANERTRPWRYLEFRKTTVQTLRDSLTNPGALAAYRKDPFNPHAIARLRPGAYQKSIFMKYIDNLLDWGDSLFSQFTMESVNEATMLYIMASDILGPRPAELGPCGETSVNPRTYEMIAPFLRPANPNEPPTTDFLIEELEGFTITKLEKQVDVRFIVYPEKTWVKTAKAATVSRMTVLGGNGVGLAGVTPASGGTVGAFSGPADPAGWNRTGAQTWKEPSATALAEVYSGEPLGGGAMVIVGGQAAPPPMPTTGVVKPGSPPYGAWGTVVPPVVVDPPKRLVPDDHLVTTVHVLDDGSRPQRVPVESAPPQPKLFELAHTRLVFCIPENRELRGYWDRVEDRLHKVRNCMDIAGVRRRLELFAPEIDPRLLVRMRAAGLSLDDVMNVTSGTLPPYRFAYLIEKARQHAGLVQSFGNQLQSALEKRDGEELTRLRAVHEQNLLKLRSQMTKWEIDAAEDTLESLRRQQQAVEYRRDHYGTLSQTGLTEWERVQQVSTHVGNSAIEMASLLQILAGGLKLLPQLGAPTAMKYGGEEMSGSALYGAGALKLIADAAELAGKSAGLESTFQRRDQDWKHQIELANKELSQLAKQITAAEIRRDIAAESQKIHERSVEQVQEIFEFLRDRFTNFGRFTWLAAELQKLHRMAFHAALSMARLAEQACAFEHPDEAAQPGLTGDYWDAGNAGLLAGDRLMLDLHTLERRYIETHHRTLEIEQSFSLARFDPNALSKLKIEGVCDFEIPEWFFDLTYPGHYRRRIKAVRLTMPCVVGPHTSLGAILRLTGSALRSEARMDSQVTVPLRHTTTIAASTGQGDAGLFEFAFRDERYLPFEGAGVNSQWQLSLPKTVRPFDYATISDVILRISYTAEEDAGLRERIEGVTGLLSTLGDVGVTRMFSLRHEFPRAWNALQGGTLPGALDILDVHLPFFLSSFTLQPAEFEFLIERSAEQPPTYPSLFFEGAALEEAGPDLASGLYSLGRSSPVSIVASHSVQANGAAVDVSKVKDIMLRVTLSKRV